jgi:hypothetical protein
MRSLLTQRETNGTLLARRLDQLGAALKELHSRLHASVAEVVGQTLGGFVRDAVWQLLDDLALDSPGPIQPPSHRPRKRWEDFSGMEAQEPDGPTFWPDGEEDRQPGLEQHRRPRPGRLALALCAGLQAAAWWLRHRKRRKGFWAALPVVLLAAGTPCAAGPLARAAQDLATSARDLGALTEVVDSDDSDRHLFGSR